MNGRCLVSKQFSHQSFIPKAETFTRPPCNALITLSSFFTSAKSSKGIRLQKWPNRESRGSHSHFRTERSVSAQPQYKTRSKHSRPASTGTLSEKHKSRLQSKSKRGEYKGITGGGLGLGASSLSGRVAQETQSTQRQAPQMPNPPP